MLRVLVSIVLVVLALCYSSQAGTPPAHFRRVAQHERRFAPVLRLKFLLTHSNQDKLLEELLTRSHPHSPVYREWLPRETVRDMRRPSAEAVSQVLSYVNEELEARDVRVSDGSDVIEATVSAATLSRVLGADVAEYEHVESGRRSVRASECVDFPEHIWQHLDLVTGLCDWFETRAEKRQRRESARRVRLAQVTTPFTPVILELTGGDQDVTAIVQLRCENGDITHNVTLPCSDTDSAWVIDGIDYNFSTMTGPHFTFYEISTSTCADDDSLGVVCQYTYELDRPLLRVNVSVSLTYFEVTSSYGFYSMMGNTTTYPIEYQPSPYLTPLEARELHGIPEDYHATNAANSLAIVSFEEQYWHFDDLYSYFQLMGLPKTVPNVRGDGYNNQTASAGGEAALDISVSMGIGVGVNATGWIFGQPGHMEYILDWALAIAETDDAPLITSISYGDQEDHYETIAGYGREYMNRFNQEAIAMGLRGLTIISGSGDAGGSNVGEGGNDIGPAETNCSPAQAFFPAASPYVIGASATVMTTETSPICHEKQCTTPGFTPVSLTGGRYWTTGGAFSNFSARATECPWQEKLVSTYLDIAENLPSDSYFNSSGCAYADVSYLGDNWLIVLNGEIISIGGTSSSGPALCGQLALVNDVLLNNGENPVGFLNPSLWMMASEDNSPFWDITYGTNKDGDLQPDGSPYPEFCPEGFYCAFGFDPPTGLGEMIWSDVWTESNPLSTSYLSSSK